MLRRPDGLAPGRRRPEPAAAAERLIRPVPRAGGHALTHLARLAVLVAWLLAVTAGWAADPPATFVGSRQCASCHAGAYQAWQGSHHALAMQPATASSVLGDFSGAQLSHSGITTRFLREGERFLVRTDGPDGAERTYPVAYTFGVAPLQQYLIEMHGGRLQALGIAWDSRPRDQGGQRWFHLYPDQRLPAGDRLHWTGRDQTWNSMCADCHSTGLRRSFDVATNTYATTWAEVNVACESCHGPGSRHVAWAGTASPDHAPDPRMGLAAWLRPTDGGIWQMDPGTGIARRTRPLVSGELDACAGCHARRKMIVEDPAVGPPFLDRAIPSLLEPGLYHPDGQIDGEVFEYGSFLQSRMHRAGVTCSDCHEPHGLTLRAQGSAVCAQCHAPAQFDTASHHHHAPAGAGGQCTACHMDTRVYMGVDRRHDHSFRVPRPDLTVAIGVPNACTSCHADRPAAWAAEAVAAWYPGGRQTRPHFGLALAAGRAGASDAERRLSALIRDREQSGIARATALALLSRFFSSASVGPLRAAVNDADPLVRMAAPRAVPGEGGGNLLPVLMPLLTDRYRAVRVEAARALAGIDPLRLPEPHRGALTTAMQALLAAEQVDADRPETQVNLGVLALRRRDLAAAEAAYRKALRLDPGFVPGFVNLADLERLRGRDAEGLALLRQALALEPDNPTVRHALGLARVRQRDLPAALAELRRAAELAPDNARYAYVHAVALHGTGVTAEALALLERTHLRHPADRDTLMALVAFSRDAGDIARALVHAQALVALDPANPEAVRMLRDLRQQQQRGDVGGP
jgi:predicted CXXCH cytochrome family protein